MPSTAITRTPGTRARSLDVLEHEHGKVMHLVPASRAERKKKSPGVIQGEQVKWLLKKNPRLRRTLEKLDLKLTVNGRIVAPKKDSCARADWKGGRLPDDPLILKRGRSSGT